MNIKLTVLSAIFAGLACSWAIAALFARDTSVRNREIFTEMAYGPSVKAQSRNDLFADGLSQQSPPDGTFHNLQDTFVSPAKPWDALLGNDSERVKNRPNPLMSRPPEERAVLAAQGATVFVNQCQSCHGVNGEGGAPVALFGIGATNLPANVNKYSDGDLFHIITYGIKTMPAHGDHVKSDDRWKLVLHLRKLAGGQP